VLMDVLWPLSGGILLGWALGSNDAANIFGTGITTNLIRYRTAVLLLITFLTLGAFLEGGKVVTTFQSLSSQTALTAFIATFSAGLVVGGMSRWGIPVSTSQAIIGAATAIGLVNGSANLKVLGKIVACWVFTPVGAVLISLVLYRALDALLRRHPLPFPIWSAVLKTGIVVSGCYGAYALGSNNVANTTGVFVAAGLISARWAVLIGAASISLGVITYSKNVIYTVGKQIFPLDPFSAFVAVLAEAITVHLFTQLGVPVSASQAIVGAVAGIGIIKNVRAIQQKRLTQIVLGWVLTPLAGGFLAALFSHLISG